ncbi:UNKNOWN [Stylonychia lemnae]|uniref:Uncharacterized protein n=1 Tax=Stylonychia lemnae TaxID=5949 RepID=A0A078AC42_STYLE|nr:UNKNOWN [Stylonychia lemnae]|eukprot:CDW79172.1 UNKNOWN [Stylonychia lemnae]
MKDQTNKENKQKEIIGNKSEYERKNPQQLSQLHAKGNQVEVKMSDLQDLFNDEAQKEQLDQKNIQSNIKKNHNKWTVNVQTTYHDGKLDVFPVYRTVSCSNAKDFRENDYHPHFSHLNNKLYVQDAKAIIDFLTKSEDQQKNTRQFKKKKFNLV